MTNVSLTNLVTGDHLTETNHRLTAWTPEQITVDGDLPVSAFPCECGRWVQTPSEDS